MNSLVLQKKQLNEPTQLEHNLFFYLVAWLLHLVVEFVSLFLYTTEVNEPTLLSQ